MSMMRFNIQVDDVTHELKAETCCFKGNVPDIAAMVSMLIQNIYISEVEEYGVQGLDAVYKVLSYTVNMVYEETKKAYLSKGDNTDET